jgi:hypothetical protein
MPPLKTPTPLHILHGRHTLMVARYNGLILCVCADCQTLLGATRSIHFIRVLDQIHDCAAPSPALERAS